MAAKGAVRFGEEDAWRRPNGLDAVREIAVVDDDESSARVNNGDAQWLEAHEDVDDRFYPIRR